MHEKVKVPTSMHSAKLEPTKLTLTDTRTTYQATGDADVGIELFRVETLGSVAHLCEEEVRATCVL